MIFYLLADLEYIEQTLENIVVAYLSGILRVVKFLAR
jgi:hypothetical protein